MYNSKVNLLLACWSNEEKKVAVKKLKYCYTLSGFYKMIKDISRPNPTLVNSIVDYLDYIKNKKAGWNTFTSIHKLLYVYNNMLRTILTEEVIESDYNIDKEEVKEDSYTLIFPFIFTYLYKTFDLRWYSDELNEFLGSDDYYRPITPKEV